MSTSRYNVQVRIGPNGETIIDESSLFVDRHEEEDTTQYTHIEESDATKFVNSATYSKKLRGSRWSAEETDLFYDALSQFGENYELISLVLPGRDRKACKNKFKAEDKRNPGRITLCLKNRRPYDIATLSRLTGKDFSGPTPVIRAPTPLRMPETPQNDSEVQSPSHIKKARAESAAAHPRCRDRWRDRAASRRVAMRPPTPRVPYHWIHLISRICGSCHPGGSFVHWPWEMNRLFFYLVYREGHTGPRDDGHYNLDRPR
ncbi:hypothetical protein NM688_g6753 [Phlebia brevispora]|uniref:Uncharacterized protein n=1 Tax=Phlebia brevispora TaxID=194682 RepID=A0ACC1SCU0_9APHY|nr:hypothetical protein NM688_g6753 [Phlebia brevispora]